MNSLTSSLRPALAARFFLTKFRMSACGVGDAATTSALDVVGLGAGLAFVEAGSEDVPQAVRPRARAAVAAAAAVILMFLRTKSASF